MYVCVMVSMYVCGCMCVYVTILRLAWCYINILIDINDLLGVILKFLSFVISSNYSCKNCLVCV